MLCNSITKKYKNILFQDLTYKFNDGLYLIKGKSGSGKTTLLKIISGNIKPDKGSITYNFDKHLITYIDASNSLILNKTVLENFAILQKRYGNSIDFDSFKKNISDLNLDSYLDKKVYEINGGYKKLIKMLMLISLKSYVFLFDEPFSELDKTKADFLLSLIYKLSKDHIVILTNHLEEFNINYDGLIDLDNKIFVESKKENDSSSKYHFSKPENDFKNIFSYVIKKKFSTFLSSLIFILLSTFCISSSLVFQRKTDQYNKTFVIKNSIENYITLLGETFNVDSKVATSISLFSSTLETLVQPNYLDDNNYFPWKNFTIYATNRLSKNNYFLKATENTLKFEKEGFKASSSDFSDIYTNYQDVLIISTLFYDEFINSNFEGLYLDNKQVSINSIETFYGTFVLNNEDLISTSFKEINETFNIAFSIPDTGMYQLKTNSKGENSFSRLYLSHMLSGTNLATFKVDKINFNSLNKYNYEIKKSSLNNYFNNQKDTITADDVHFLSLLIFGLVSYVLFLIGSIYLSYKQEKDKNLNNHLSMLGYSNLFIQIINILPLIFASILSIAINILLTTIAVPNILNSFVYFININQFNAESYFSPLSYYLPTTLGLLLSIFLPFIFTILCFLFRRRKL